jgi:hypothetical protein
MQSSYISSNFVNARYGCIKVNIKFGDPTYLGKNESRNDITRGKLESASRIGYVVFVLRNNSMG